MEPLRAPTAGTGRLSTHEDATGPRPYLISGGSDGLVKLWEVARGHEVATIQAHSTGPVLALALSPDGQPLATGSCDQTVKLWDLATGHERATLRGHTGLVHAVAFAPGGQLLASGSGDRTIKLWNLTTGKEQETLGGIPVGSPGWLSRRMATGWQRPARTRPSGYGTWAGTRRAGRAFCHSTKGSQSPMRCLAGALRCQALEVATQHNTTHFPGIRQAPLLGRSGLWGARS